MNTILLEGEKTHGKLRSDLPETSNVLTRSGARFPLTSKALRRMTIEYLSETFSRH